MKLKNPIIPATLADRTGSGRLVARAFRDIEARWSSAGAAVAETFLRIPRLEINDASNPVRYAMTPQQMAQVAQEIADTLIRWIAEGKDTSGYFWWDTYPTEAAQMGAAQSVANLSALSEAYAATTTMQAVLSQPAYVERVGMAKFKSYEHWSGLSSSLRGELSEIIGRAVVDGKNPRDVVTEIAGRLEVSKNRAKLYAQTDITDALRQARWAESDRARDEMGIRVGLLWTSALKATTRATHAAKHGKVYNSTEVREFYSRDGNRFRCYCATTECLLDDRGRPMLTDNVRMRLKNERGAWDLADGKRKAASP